MKKTDFELLSKALMIIDTKFNCYINNILITDYILSEKYHLSMSLIPHSDKLASERKALKNKINMLLRKLANFKYIEKYSNKAYKKINFDISQIKLKTLYAF